MPYHKSMYKNANVTVMVSDIDRAIKFYTETLGLKLTQNYGGHWAEIEGPGITIGLHPGRSGDVRQKLVSIGFGVENIEKAVAMLKERGIEATVSADTGVKLASFADPDGTPLYFAEAS